MTRLTRVTVSPVSFTVVSDSVRSTTALTSSAYFFTGCCAAARTQSGTPAIAGKAPVPRKTRKTTALIPLLTTPRSLMKYGLLLIARLDFAEKALQFRVLLQRCAHHIELQDARGHKLSAAELD